ncbi:MAG: rRNA maturation RNase YbeY [Mycoplasma sp.]
MIEINYCIDSSEIKIDLDSIFDTINKQTRKTLQTTDSRDLVVNVVSLEEIIEINKTYRNKDSATDVITFCFDEAGFKSPILGEIYLCWDVTLKQAKAYNHSIKREAAFLFIHGLLHLFGYDHIIKEDEEIMFALQDQILKECKFERDSND